MITSSLYNLLRMIAFSVNCSKQALHKKVGKGLPLGVTFLVAIKALENEQKLENTNYYLRITSYSQTQKMK